MGQTAAASGRADAGVSEAGLADGAKKRSGIPAREANRDLWCELMALFPPTIVRKLTDANLPIGVPRD
jgi:hypothetical protein